MIQGRGTAGSQCQHARTAGAARAHPAAPPPPEATGHLLFGTTQEEGGSRLGDSSTSNKTELEPLGEEGEMLRGSHVSTAGQGAAQLYIC